MTIVGNQIAVNLDNILFATDFSPSAQIARLYVQALAARYQSQVRMMHVVDLGAAFKAPDAGLTIDIFRRFGEESLARFGSELLSEKIRVETILCEAIDPAAEILEAARERSIDLLVIGTRGYKGLARLVLGSTAEELIHKAGCPILAIGPSVPAPKQPSKFSADRLCHGFLSRGCESVRVCSHLCPGFRCSSLSLPCASRGQ